MKLVSPGLAGVPDRLLLFQGEKIAFCEVKAPGQKPRPLQEHRIAQLRALGFKVFVLDNPSQIEGIISRVISTKAEGRVEKSPPQQIPNSMKGEPREI